MIFAICFAFYKVIYVANFDDFKKFLKIVLARVSGILVPILLFSIYFSINGIWTDFIDYTVSGIGTFSNSISYFKLFNDPSLFIKIMAIVFPVLTIGLIMLFLASYKVKELEDEEWFKNLVLLLIYGLTSSVVIIPISDRAHFAIGTVCTFLTFLYCIYVTISKMVKSKNVRNAVSLYSDILSKILFAILIIWAICKNVEFIRNENRHNELKHFSNTCMDNGLKEESKKVGAYIKEKENEGKKVYMLDFASAIYTIPVEKYSKNFDMFNLGNFGGRGEDGIIDDIDKTENVVLLIRNPEHGKNWQHPTKVTDYVEKNYKLIDTVERYDVYEK